MTIDELVAEVAAGLPEGWAIDVEITRGGAEVYLVDVDGDQDEIGPVVGLEAAVEDSVLRALELARKAAAASRVLAAGRGSAATEPVRRCSYPADQSQGELT